MADYQHVIPIHADIARQKKRKWMDLDPLAGDSLAFIFVILQISCLVT